MRRSFPVQIPAGQSWPGSGVDGTKVIAGRYAWIRVDNRSPAAPPTGTPADVACALQGPAQGINTEDWDTFRAGEKRVRNVGERSAGGHPASHDLPDELHFKNLSAVNAAVLWVDLDDKPIVDISAQSPGSTSLPAHVSIDQIGGIATPTPAGAALPGMPILDVSQYNLETSATLAGAATFTGAWRDTLYYNWFAALALADVGGTLVIDEADAAAPTVTNLVAKQAAAATDALAPSPPAAGFQARIAPVKSLLRFQRVRYINGATIQARFNLQSSLSPVN